MVSPNVYAICKYYISSMNVFIFRLWFSHSASIISLKSFLRYGEERFWFLRD
jgi:hypothetical protein